MKTTSTFRLHMGILLVLLCGFARALHGQNLTGEITGTIKDSTGAAIQGARVTLINTDQNLVVRTTVSNGAGEFTVPSLLIGNYAITAEAPGFQSEHVAAIQLHVNDTLSIPIQLTVGSVDSSITVSASAVQPNTVSASASSLINGTQMKELSLNTRNFQQLVALQPGVSGNAQGQYRGIVGPTGANNGANFSVNGTSMSYNGYFFDGADIINHGGVQTAIYPSVDAIQEESIIRNAYDAQYGGNGSAITLVQSRSGTTAFHGDAYFFSRSQVLNANDYFNNLAGVPRAPIRYADFGYTIGGPVWIPRVNARARAKVFFFVSQEFLRSATTTTETLTNIPTAAQRAGTFSGVVCVAYSSAGKCTATSTQVEAIDPTAQAYLKDMYSLVPLPNSPSDPQGLIVALSGFDNESQTMARGDYQINDRLGIFFRYIHDPFTLVTPFGFAQTTGAPGINVTDATDGGTNYLGHFSYARGANTVFEGGYDYYPYYITTALVGALNPANSPDIHPVLPYTKTLARVPGISLLPATSAGKGPYVEGDSLQQVFLNITHTRGRHTVFVGGNYEFVAQNLNLGTTNAGSFTFSGTAPTGSTATQFMQEYANFLVGYVSTFTQASIDPRSHSRKTIFEAYVQDNFRITPRLSLTGGVRYSSIGLPTEKLGVLDSFDPQTYNPANAPTIGTNGLICATAPCSGGGRPNAAFNPLNGFIGPETPVAPFGGKVGAQPVLNFAPRLGFAYDVFGNGKTSLRGGFGVYFLQIAAGAYQNEAFNNPPNVQLTSITNTSFDSPGGGVPVLSAVPALVYGTQPNWMTPYTESWSLDLQRELTSKTILDVGYYGNVARHLTASEDINEPLPGAYVTQNIAAVDTLTAANSTLLNQIRPYKGYGPIASTDPKFMSDYNSLQTSITHRFGKQSLVNANYTYSKALGNAASPQNIYNLPAEYGPVNGSEKHIFNADFVYAIPFFEAQKGIVGRLAGGWEFSGVVSTHSGDALTATPPTGDPGGIGVLVTSRPGAARPDQVANPNQNTPHTRLQWFNTAAFVAVPAGQARPGNSPPGGILGPGFQQWDLSAFRNIAIAKETSLQLRLETFNTFNHTNFSGVSVSMASTNYGQVTSAGSARNLQLGAKLRF